MAGCHLSYTWQQQSTFYPQVCHEFFKAIRKVRLQAGFLVLFLWFYVKYKLCLLFSDVIRDRTWNIYFCSTSVLMTSSSTNKTREGNQVCVCSSLVSLNPLLQCCFSTRMNSDGFSLLPVGPGSQQVFGDSSLSWIVAQATAVSVCKRSNKSCSFS